MTKKAESATGQYCPGCGYDRTGIPPEVCPECGSTQPAARLTRQQVLALLVELWINALLWGLAYAAWIAKGLSKGTWPSERREMVAGTLVAASVLCAAFLGHRRRLRLASLSLPLLVLLQAVLLLLMMLGLVFLSDGLLVVVE